jgi:hypothetical protein
MYFIKHDFGHKCLHRSAAKGANLEGPEEELATEGS